MKIDGIDGNVTASGHEKWIELHSVSFGQGRGILSARPGHQSNREALDRSGTNAEQNDCSDERSNVRIRNR